MKRVMVVVFVILMSMSVVVFSSEKLSDIDTVEAQNADVKQSIVEVPMLVIETSFKSKNQEVIAFRESTRFITISSDTPYENVNYFDYEQLMLTDTEEDDVLLNEHISKLLCFHLSFCATNTTFKNEYENSPERNRPLLCFC